MKLSTKTRYAIMAMVDIAFHSKGKPVSLADISVRENIPLNYLEQIFVFLRKDNLVLSVKGPGGGYKLANNPEKISINDVVASLKIDLKMTRCSPDNHACAGESVKCMTHHLWEGLENNIKDYFKSITLKDLITKNTYRVSAL